MTRVAVVTGANKGLGYNIVKQLCKTYPDWTVYLTARDARKGQEAVASLKSEGLNPHFYVMDILFDESIEKFRNFLVEKHGGIDVLINNVVVAFTVDSKVPFSEQATATAATNYFGTLQVCRTFLPILRSHGRIVTISSMSGHENFKKCSAQIQQAFRDCKTINDVDVLLNTFIDATRYGKHSDDGWPTAAFGTAHIALTTASCLMQKVIDEDTTKSDRIVNCCSPGYYPTEASTQNGVNSSEDAANTPMYLATLSENCKDPRGCFVSNRKVQPLF